MRKVFALLLIFTMLIALTGNVMAEEEIPGYMIKSGTYHFEGDINWDVHVGNNDTGAQQRFVVKGKGELYHEDHYDIKIGELMGASSTQWISERNLTVISSIKVGIAPAEDVYTDQVYATYLSPNHGETGYLHQQFIAQHGEDYVDSFLIDYQSGITNGETRRYISLSSGTSLTSLEDYLVVNGFAQFKEELELYDLVLPFALAANWMDIF